VLDSARRIDTMLSAWNARDESVLEQLVQESLSLEVEFCDPHYAIRGHAPFIEMVKAFWAKHGDCKISRASVVDAHHDRARYAWAIALPNGHRFEGFDAVAFELPSGKVRRIDGFFGSLTPI
jgi:SnoaL-like domain